MEQIHLRTNEEGVISTEEGSLERGFSSIGNLKREQDKARINSVPTPKLFANLVE
jgi:hypothetical protein